MERIRLVKEANNATGLVRIRDVNLSVDDIGHLNGDETNLWTAEPLFNVIESTIPTSNGSVTIGITTYGKDLNLTPEDVLDYFLQAESSFHKLFRRLGSGSEGCVITSDDGRFAVKRHVNDYFNSTIETRIRRMAGVQAALSLPTETQELDDIRFPTQYAYAVVTDQEEQRRVEYVLMEKAPGKTFREYYKLWLESTVPTLASIGAGVNRRLRQNYVNESGQSISLRDMHKENVMVQELPNGEVVYWILDQ